MSEEEMYDTPKFVLIVVFLFHAYSLLIGISLIIKLMHNPIEPIRQLYPYIHELSCNA